MSHVLELNIVGTKLQSKMSCSMHVIQDTKDQYSEVASIARPPRLNFLLEIVIDKLLHLVMLLSIQDIVDL